MNANEYADSPTVWFALLERAIRANDAELRERAESKLRELGVVVSFAPPAFTRNRTQGGKPDAH